MTDTTVTNFSFRPLLDMGESELIIQLIDTHEILANLHERVGFLKAEKYRDKASYATEELAIKEEAVKSYEEKKWLIIKLIDLKGMLPPS